MQIAWWGAVAVFALALYWAFSPGIANPDTIGIIAQGITGNINNWHSPAASLFAGLAYPLGMPNGFLVVQATLAAACVACLATWVWKAISRQDAVLSVAVASLAAYTALLIVLASSQSIKDMWIVLLLTSACIVLFQASTPVTAGAAIAFCALGVLIRPVSIFPAIPIVLVSATSFTGDWRKIAAIAGVALASISLLPSFVDAASGAKAANPASPLFVYDIVGIAVQTPDPSGFVRERLDEAFPDQQLQNCYNSKTVEPFFWGACTIKSWPLPTAGTWLRTIYRYPIEYVRHRFAYYTELLARIDVQMDGWVDRPMFLEASSNSPTWIGKHSLPPEVKISLTGDGDNAVLNALIDVQRSLSKGIGSPYVWTAISFAAIALAWFYSRTFRSRRFLVVTAISLSSVANTISFMLFSAHAGARYLGWSLVGAALAMALASLSLAKNRTGTVADQDPLRA